MSENHKTLQNPDGTVVPSLSDMLACLRNPDERSKSIGIISLMSDDDFKSALGRSYQIQTNDKKYPRYLKYEQYWFKYAQAAAKLVLKGIDNVHKIMHILQRDIFLSGSKYIGEALFMGQLMKVPSYIISPWRDTLALNKIWPFLTEDVECVIELGAGPALFLHKIWSTDGPHNADYYACELTLSGRITSEIIASVDDSYSFESRPFNYLEPVIELSKKYQKAVVFTKGSIEQIPELPVSVIEGIRSVAQDVTCIHFEPVGWQILDEDQYGFLTATHKRRCLEANYNRNLWPLLCDVDREGKIEILGTDLNFSGKSDHYETYIAWRKI